MNQYPPLVSAFVTLILALVLALNKDGLLQDIPNERSLHTEPIPRTGGIALIAGVFSGWVLMFKLWLWWIMIPVLGLFVLSLIDDARNLKPGTKLIGHIVAAVIVVLEANIDWAWVIPVLLFIVWMTNLYNFMDGSDGMAGGMALFGFSFYGIASLMKGNESFAMMNFTIGAAALGFLYHNFYPAKIFLGDAGSIPLGFLAAVFGVWGWQQGYWPFWFPMQVFSPFIVDATLTLVQRIRRREKVMLAHRTHYYQRLIQMGWGHQKTAIYEYVLMVAAGLSAIWGLDLEAHAQANLLVWSLAIYLGLSIKIDKLWKQFIENGRIATNG